MLAKSSKQTALGRLSQRYVKTVNLQHLLQRNKLKKYIYIFIFFAIVTNWDIVTSVLGFSDNKYTIGNYTNTKWYYGHSDYIEAMKVSDQNETPTLIYMRTDWCQYCKKFESNLLTNTDVNTQLSKFVKIKINPDNSAQDKKLYNSLNGKGFPTIMLKYGASGTVIRVRAPYTKNGNKWKLMTANEFINTLQKYGS